MQNQQICIVTIKYFNLYIDKMDTLGNITLMFAANLNLYDEATVLIDYGADICGGQSNDRDVII